MTRDELRTGGAVFLFSAFTVVALCFLLEPFFPGRTGTVVVNETKIYYNSGWLTVYFLTLAAALVLNLVFGARKRVLLTVLGVLAGSLAVLNLYGLPSLLKVLDSFDRQGLKLIQDYLPHLAVAVGTLLYWGLLSFFNQVFR